MRLRRIIDYQCTWTVQAGEYQNDQWIGEQCKLSGRTHVIVCDHCGEHFCYLYHWHSHLDTINKESESK